MKKLMVILIALAMVGGFTATSMAADWAFYGNARMTTFWVSEDLGDATNAAGDDDDGDLTWALQGNSRIGANVKHDAVRGRFEYGTGVNVRHLYGEWDFGTGKLLAGQTQTPMSDPAYAAQVFGGDRSLNGWGTPWAGRHPMLQLTFGVFQLAFIEPRNTDDTFGLTADTDTYLPKIEFSYMPRGDNWFFDIYGGVQTFSVETVADDFDVTSWGLGIGGGVSFGAAYVNATIQYYVNGAQAGWDGGGAPALDAAGTDIDDNDSFQGAIVVGFKASDMVSFEAGFGYQQEELDVSGSDEDEQWAVYVQAPLKVGPGVVITPEIGYNDFGDSAADADEGSEFYIGAKWFIGF